MKRGGEVRSGEGSGKGEEGRGDKERDKESGEHMISNPVHLFLSRPIPSLSLSLSLPPSLSHTHADTHPPSLSYLHNILHG